MTERIEIKVPTREEASEVLACLREIVDQYGEASVADLHDLVGIVGDYMDSRFGWRSVELSGVVYVRSRSGWTIVFPPAVSLTQKSSTVSPVDLSVDDLGKAVTVRSWQLDTRNIPTGDPDVYVGTLEGFWSNNQALTIKLNGFTELHCPKKLFLVEVYVK